VVSVPPEQGEAVSQARPVSVSIWQTNPVPPVSSQSIPITKLPGPTCTIWTHPLTNATRRNRAKLVRLASP
jgi:hypothetical protein